NVDLTSTGGYDTIIQYLNDGRRTCKEVEDFMKARASIEEKYAKELLSLSKKVCGHTEMNTLKKSLDFFKLRKSQLLIFLFIYLGATPPPLPHECFSDPSAETEQVSLAHLQLAHNVREEAKKLEEFRLDQKERRKKMEQTIDALHKLKSTQFKKTMEAKKMYEHKCRDKEEADQNVNRNTNTGNAKQMEKVESDPKDTFYQQSVKTLAKVREDWIEEHVKACEVFEHLAKERIVFLRNAVWMHLNHLSQQCVTNDEVRGPRPRRGRKLHASHRVPVAQLYEEVRRTLEQCSVQKDIDHFVNLRRTGEKPAAPVLYENFYSAQRSPTP
ncbi:unnamed protein product, partial [Tetraodon nigroviridis]